MHPFMSLAAALLALSRLASAHQARGSTQHAGHHPAIPRSLSRRWESLYLQSLARHASDPRTAAVQPRVESPDKTLGGTPTNAIPKHYDITIHPDFEKLIFNGTVIIDLELTQDSESIFLHARNITLLEWVTEMTFPNGTELQLSGPVDVTATETESGVIFSHPEKLVAGSTAKMSIIYQGVVFPAEEAFGLFQNPYKKDDGSSGMFLLTQLQMDGARRILPCLDDPALKANFTVSLISAESHTCLSNMDVDTEAKVGGNKKVTFHTSPPMSTYLLALAVGELHSIESSGFRVPIRLHGSPARNMETAQYTLGVAVEGMKKLEEVVGVDYALPKIDHVAVEGGAFGGMENWGLITLDRSMVFLDNRSTPDTRLLTAEIVLHELAHMWFGDLVTMEWWTHIWLNEGFADYFTYWALKASYPDLEMTSQMPQWLRQAAMQADSIADPHPLEIPSTTELSKPAIFDTISYMKGASVLRMIEAYMGEKNFMDGLHRYLVANDYENTVTLDLWTALGEGAMGMWSPWTKNPGHPVVYVGETEDSIVLEQHRFRWGSNATAAEDSVVFPIPLLLRTADGVDTSVVFDERQATVQLRSLDFFFVNADAAGFYRVAYTPARLRTLATQHDRLTPADRLGLIHDTMVVASTGRLSVVDGLGVIAAFMRTDEDYWVWLTMLESGVDTAASLWLYDDEITGGFDAFVRTQTSLLVKRLGWPADYWKLEHTDDDRLTRFQSLIFEHAGLAGDEEAVKAAKAMVARFPVEGESAIDPNILEAAIWIAVKYGGEEEHSIVVAAYNATDVENLQAKALLLRALGKTTSQPLLERTLGLLLDDAVPPPLKPFIMEGVASSGLGLRVAARWVQDRWPDLAASAGAPHADILARLVARMTRRADVDALSGWMADPARAPYLDAVGPAVQLALATAQWAERDLERVRGWLAE